jgi:hypothetical protein
MEGIQICVGQARMIRRDGCAAVIPVMDGSYAQNL